jgi:hypothetical protein
MFRSASAQVDARRAWLKQQSRRMTTIKIQSPL